MRATTGYPARRRPAVWAALIITGALVAGLFAAGAATTATAGPLPVAAAAKKDDPTFRVSSFNILGWRHTAKGGKNAGMDSGERRMNRVVSLLGKRHISVAGLQEMQPQQHQRFKQLVGNEWGVYPGDSLSRYAMHNSIVWRTSEWRAVELNTIGIPYFNGEIVPMPYVLLQNLKSHRMVWFANFHNPADGGGRSSQAKWRNRAKALEVALANELWETGVPLVLTGDMNEKDNYFCSMAGQAPMRSASGGTATSTSCSPAPGGRIDWIFGSQDLRLSGYRVLQTKFVRRTSDHPMLYADVSIPGRPRG